MEQDSKGIENYIELEKLMERLDALGGIAKLLHWDLSVNMPAGGAFNRQKQMSTLTAEMLRIQTSDETKNLIKKADDEQHKLDDWQKENLKLIKKSSEELSIIPLELQQKAKELAAASQLAWQDAKKNNDFKSFAPKLDELLEIKQRIIKIRAEHFSRDKYAMLVDDFDPERSAQELENIFSETKTKLLPLIQKIIDKQSSEEYTSLSQPISKDIQKQIGLKIIETMGLDMNKSRLDESVHPFCIGIGNSDDVRMTSAYDENDFLFGLYAIIHETGHCLYQQNLPSKYIYQPVGGPKGMGFHESQSLIMEMQVGTSRGFIEYLAKMLKDQFGFDAKEYSADNLFKLKNRVEPGLIRIKSDEVTYPIHVMIRYEIEQLMLDGQLKAADIPAIWDQKMVDYLGVKPANEFEGCMQDVHWPSGALGYFPSYYVGAMIASMLMAKVKAVDGGVDDEIAKGNFGPINDYLNKNLRSHASRYSSQELLYKSTGHRDLQTDIFLKYLEEKYL